jgi:hypothetical protein
VGVDDVRPERADQEQQPELGRRELGKLTGATGQPKRNDGRLDPARPQAIA